MLPYTIATAPVRFFRGVANSGLREILFVIPALAMLDIHNRYADEVQQAMQQGDFKKAKTYFTRIMQDNELTQPQKLQWMVVLAQTGEPDKAEQILDELAPDDGIGFALAHRAKALRIAFSRKDKNAPLPLKQLEKHLTRSRDNSPMIQQAWAIYYRAVDNPDKAIAALQAAAQEDPTYYIAIAKYEASRARPDQQQNPLAVGKHNITTKSLRRCPRNSRGRNDNQFRPYHANGPCGIFYQAIRSRKIWTKSHGKANLVLISCSRRSAQSCANLRTSYQTCR